MKEKNEILETMNSVCSIVSKNKRRTILKKIITVTNFLMSLFILMSLLGLVFYVGWAVYAAYTNVVNLDFTKLIHGIVFILVLVKAYKVLVFYLKRHHLSIKYMIEISIIAPSIELIFAPNSHSLMFSILLALFAVSNLLIYVIYYDKLCEIDEKEGYADEVW
ncbi:MAG: hypothetical protein N4A36_01180 [Candidatus Gracilibacteria bacterium]|jgi:uncharacterized membrane protein (DUF373 family)|nr:hypothetical protein [Candidatus Gracilibacteria bacterium]